MLPMKTGAVICIGAKLFSATLSSHNLLRNRPCMAQCYTASDLGPAEAQHGKRSIGQTAMFSAGLREALEANGQIGKHAQSWTTPD